MGSLNLNVFFNMSTSIPCGIAGFVPFPSMFCISIEGCYILFLLFGFCHGDGFFGHRALGRAFGVAADFHRDIEAGAFFSFSGGLISAGLVGVKGYPYTLGCFVQFVNIPIIVGYGLSYSDRKSVV